ncbi:MAG: OmpA family protein [Rubrivivax sp.]
MKKFWAVAVGLVLAMSVGGCKASVKVQAKTPEPEKVKEPEPAPAPPPPAPVEEAPKQGEAIMLPVQIEFEFNEARIKQTPETLDALNKLADVMTKHPNITKLRIEGHTDNVGSKKRNEKLSKARAEAVARWLSEHEVATTRMVTAGYGAKRPLVPNDNEAHRAQNRRTEYYVEEVDGKKLDQPTTKVAGSPAGGKTKNAE